MGDYPIGKNIKKLREQHKLTRAQFGALIGKSESTVYAYESGSSVPPFSVLLTIASLFEVAPGTILGLKSSLATATSVRELYKFYLELVGDDEQAFEEYDCEN